MSRRRGSRSSFQHAARDASVHRHPRAPAGRDVYLAGNFFSPSFDLDLSWPTDRRLWSPEPFEIARTDRSRPARLMVGPPSTPSRGRSPAFLSPKVAFQTPLRVDVCLRRRIRARVLHAKGVAGRRGLARPRRSAYSSVSCR